MIPSTPHIPHFRFPLGPFDLFPVLRPRSLVPPPRPLVDVLLLPQSLSELFLPELSFAHSKKLQVLDGP